MIKGMIVGQRLTIQKPLIVSDTINYLTALFSFKTEDWAGLEKWAHFCQGETVYDIKLVEDTIPQKSGLNLPAGRWEIYLHGNAYENGDVVQRITTNPVEITVQESGTLEGGPLPVTPASLGEQLEARIKYLEQYGKSGVTFVPSISEDGVLSWSNDGGLENPEPVDLKVLAMADVQDELDKKVSYDVMSHGSCLVMADLTSFSAAWMLTDLTNENDYKVWIYNTADGYYYHCTPLEVLESFAGGAALEPAETLPPWAESLAGKTTETWQFTLEDGSVLTKQVIAG